jgi:redox-sensing transcriptional repressor
LREQLKHGYNACLKKADSEWVAKSRVTFISSENSDRVEQAFQTRRQEVGELFFGRFCEGGHKLKFLKVPEATIRRLSRYSRCLENLTRKGEQIVSSAQLAAYCGVNAAQVRKDLAYFGEFGIRGVGYYATELMHDIKRILGLNKEWRLAIVGIGNLGSSLLSYKDFLKQNYKIVAAFDIDPPKVIGRVSEKLGKPIEILHPDRMKEVVRERDIEVGIITTPASEAQSVVDQMVDAGIRGILNFAPAQIRVPEGFIIKNVFFTTVLDNLAYLLSTSKEITRIASEQKISTEKSADENRPRKGKDGLSSRRGDTGRF